MQKKKNFFFYYKLLHCDGLLETIAHAADIRVHRGDEGVELDVKICQIKVGRAVMSLIRRNRHCSCNDLGFR